MNTAAMPVARRIAALPSPPALPFPGNAQQFKPRTIHQAMKNWSGHDGPIFLAQLRPATGAAPEQAMALSMAPCATQETSNSPMNTYVNS